MSYLLIVLEKLAKFLGELFFLARPIYSKARSPPSRSGSKSSHQETQLVSFSARTEKNRRTAVSYNLPHPRYTRQTVPIRQSQHGTQQPANWAEALLKLQGGAHIVTTIGTVRPIISCLFMGLYYVSVLVNVENALPLLLSVQTRHRS